MAAAQPDARTSPRPQVAPAIAYGACTDAAGRPLNEDACTPDLRRVPGKEHLGRLAAVADGMGGGAAGGAASAIAINTLVDQYFEASIEGALANLQRAVGEANRAVYAYGATPGKSGVVGTTLVAAAVVGAQAALVSVGDSRAYLVRGGQVAQLTRDHTWANQQVAQGALTQQQAAAHPSAPLLTYVLGQGPALQVPVSGQPDGMFSFLVDLQPGDALVLCSDGVTNVLPPHELAALVRQSAAPQAAARIVARAKARRTSDNATAVVIQYGPTGGGPALPLPAAGGGLLAT
ncbi:MAG TPA: serine/threonine-protein phosphatase, partial [Chloroflexaceae bacterium]|nr:serine/threonine-protein phosphatase [Chloroflexaceae bacterium]